MIEWHRAQGQLATSSELRPLSRKAATKAIKEVHERMVRFWQNVVIEDRQA